QCGYSHKGATARTPTSTTQSKCPGPGGSRNFLGPRRQGGRSTDNPECTGRRATGPPRAGARLCYRVLQKERFPRSHPPLPARVAEHAGRQGKRAAPGAVLLLRRQAGGGDSALGKSPIVVAGG